jgi:hypothetical protein
MAVRVGGGRIARIGAPFLFAAVSLGLGGCAVGGSAPSGPPTLPSLVTPQPVRAEQPVSWTTAWVVNNGLAVDVDFHEGPGGCRQPSRVTAEEHAGDVVITLYAATPGGGSTPCSAEGPAVRVRVELDHPVAGRMLLDGAREAAGRPDGAHHGDGAEHPGHHHADGGG